MKDSYQDYIEQLKEKWPYPIVARKLSGEASGKTISPKTMANFDCAGEGPEGAFRMGGQTVYPAESFFAWLANRARPIERKARRIPPELLA